MTIALITLAATGFFFALLVFLNVVIVLARGGTVNSAGMFIQPLYSGVGVGFGFWMLSLAGVL